MSLPIDSRALIALATATLRNELIPGLTGSQRLSAQMIANALGIAIRQIDQQASATHDAHRSLAALLDDSDVPLEELEMRLVASIRRGDTDPGSALHSRLQDHLEAVATREVGQSNPRYLD